jgi:ribonuclease HI
MSTNDLPIVAIYADESCLGNGKDGDNNPGGAGALLEYLAPDGSIVRRDLWLSEKATTNNRMAIASVLASCDALSRKGRTFRVVFTSDSRYLIDGLTDWVHGWASRGWVRKTGPIENLELWFDALDAARPHQAQWRWVRGHNGHAQNEYANFLATRAAARQDATDGWVESGFETWMAEQRAARKKVGAPEPFPVAEDFRPARVLPRVPSGHHSES